MTDQIVRIVLRYLAGALVTYGLASAASAEQIATDPVLIDWIVAGIGAAIALVTERWFSKSDAAALARR
ncbi:hypothetical protein [Loktanella sp. R86503]|uniref:hypothetical protein n=1 Tax=Loktanella sp. R86503 TaxID=3093847 RepID=UPI0036D98561